MSQRSLREDGPAPGGLEFAAALLPLWGFPPGTGIDSVDEQGTNNRTFLVRHEQQRYVLRVSGFLSVAEVRAEHRILSRLRQGPLPFQVPEPVAAPGGRTVLETTAGPATVCRWLPGVRPGLDDEAAFERFGRATGLLGAALAEVPLADVLRDWRTDPRWIQPGEPPVDVLCGELRSAGMSAGQAELLGAAADRAGRWWTETGRLPAQAIHGDFAPSNALADADTGEVTGLLDFELAGAGFRVQDILAALYNSTALRTPDWPGRTAAFLRGCASVRSLEAAEVAALPELLIVGRSAPSCGGSPGGAPGSGPSARSPAMWTGWRQPRDGLRPTGMRSWPSRPPRTADAAPGRYSLEVAAGAWHAGGMLSEAEIDSFVTDGFVAVRGAVPAGVLRACQDDIWTVLGERGLRRGVPATWRDPVVRIPCPESEAFAAAGTQPSLWEAFDQLIGTERWWRRKGVGGTIPVRFPSQADPGDAGWHIEASYETNGEWRVNHRSRARGLLALYLFSDVDADSAPTRVRPGSHRDAARTLAPAGDEGMPWSQAAQLAAQASATRPTSLVTGRAGDVFMCHPFLVHAASWPHSGRHPRIMAQPGVALHDAFPLVNPLSPVELAMAAPG